MTGKESFDFIKGFTYFQDGCYKTQLDAIKQDLEKLENIKSKTHLLYGQRIAIAKEYIDWCEKK